MCTYLSRKPHMHVCFEGPCALVCRFGRLDVCFNNAGIEGERAPVHEYSADTFNEVGPPANGFHHPVTATVGLTQTYKKVASLHAPHAGMKMTPLSAAVLVALGSTGCWHMCPSLHRPVPYRISGLLQNWYYQAHTESVSAASHAKATECSSGLTSPR